MNELEHENHRPEKTKLAKIQSLCFALSEPQKNVQAHIRSINPPVVIWQNGKVVEKPI
jgi:hypothetical protein